MNVFYAVAHVQQKHKALVVGVIFENVLFMRTSIEYVVRLTCR